MVLPFDAIAWIDHVPPIGIEVVMPNTSRSSATVRTAASSTGDAAIINDFIKEVSNLETGAHTWTPEKIQERVVATSDKLNAYHTAEDARSFEDISRRIRQEILGTEDVGAVQPAPVLPKKNRMTTMQFVDEIAANIQFG
jgi:hypothetical protein